MGLPAHPLLVHAAVVFVPLQSLAALAYALVPPIRRQIEWAVVGLAVVAPAAAWFATLSGNALRDRLASQGMGAEVLARIDQHRDFGEQTLRSSLGLAVLTVLLVVLVVARKRRPVSRAGKWSFALTVVLTLGVLVLAAASAYYVFKTGDSGARVVWGAVSAWSAA